MMIATAIIGILCYGISSKKVIVEGKETTRVRIGFVVILVAYIVFFIGFRDKVLDTGAYISSFKSMPTDFTGLFLYLETLDSGKAFYFLSAVFKMFISDNYYAWLFFLAIVSCGCLFRTIYKYSIDFPLSAYLFIATTTFTWLLNGTRQFLVVCILFGFVEWIIEGKKIRYILLALALTTIHSSAKGLHTYLNKEYDNLITQDIICHGVPSPLVWEKYIDKYSELQEVKFRDKRFGWHYFSMYIKSKKGTYRKRLDEDFYERLFLDNTTLRPICYDCPVKRSGSGADITLADCWGSDKLCKEIQDTDRGLSLVLIHTKQGKYLWKKLIENQCIRTERLAAEKALSSQSALIESAPCNPRRKVFFESLQKSGFAKLEKSWYGDSVIRRIKRKEIYYKTKLLFMIKVKDKMGKNK